jgi:hypothetical protein
MDRRLLSPLVLLFSLFLAAGANANTFVDGVSVPGGTGRDYDTNIGVGLGGTVDVVGGTDNTASGFGLAKGNSYEVTTSAALNEAEFWLNFTGSETLNYYVYQCPTEFGLYTMIYSDSETVFGLGPAWYSSGPISVQLTSGQHYIIAVSWSGGMTYYYNVGDSQAVSFGTMTHGYATGSHPLPGSFNSNVNDQAIYYQRLTTNAPVSVESESWASVKDLYR